MNIGFLNTETHRDRQLLLGIVAFICGSLIFTAITYFLTHDHLMRDIDRQLLLAAYATEGILDESIHRQSLDENSMSDQRDYEISMILTDFVRQIGIEYVYSVIQNDGEIIFVTSSATEEELANNTYIPAYFMAYPEADDSLYQTFADGEIRYSQYSDRWGNFRSIFLPLTAPDGRRFVIGADISVQEASATAKISAGIALLACFGLGLIALPLVVLYTRSVRREAAQEIEQMYRCPLTGLPNRSRLLEDLKGIETANISVINIDKFREVTMLHGPAVGDDVLKQFSVRLSHIDSSGVDNYKAYRLGADEFATLVSGRHDPKLLEQQLDKLYHHLIKHPYQAGTKRIKLRIRMGAASNGEEAFALADMALRAARDNNQSLVIYNSELHLPEAYKRNFEETQTFRKAVEADQFQLFYQPFLNTNTGEFDKYECLARMVDDKGQVIASPDGFLPVAYRSRLYNRFSRLMLDKIFTELKQHQQRVSINLSISDINHEPTTRYLFKRLSDPNIAQRVDFEILENENIENLGKIVRFIQRIKAYGCRVGLDDLGKDYSNIDRLMVLPVDFVKIDGNIINHLVADKQAQDLTRMIISFAYKRNIETVAEFCCDSKISDMARRLGVDYLQGFHIGEPRPDIQSFLNPPADNRANVAVGSLSP